MSRYLEELNEKQRLPVEHVDGPLIIIAGAGAGKTRVLTYRIAYLLERGIHPYNILALTFTNKAALEMKQRISKIVGNSTAKSLWMGTFHSVFNRILHAEADKLGYPNNFTIYDTQDSHRLINSVIKDMNLNKDLYKYKQIFSRISSYKNNLITVKSYFSNPELIENDAIAMRPRLGDIYKTYVDTCFRSGAMDFDDLLLKTNELLSLFPDVLMKYQDLFRYIMVDEYQDTNHSQYLIVRALSDRFQNICVVGDDSQSIYAFRGANINNILNFQKDFNDSKIYRLEQNYRSTKNIVNASNSLISHNKIKLEKNIWTHNEDGDKVTLFRAITDAQEAIFVAKNIWNTTTTEQRPYSDFAILYRTNGQSRALEDALRKQDVPYRIFGGISFYQRKEIKDIIAYMRLVINPKDDESLIRIINFPRRGIGATTIERLTVIGNQYNRSLYEVMINIGKVDSKMAPSTIKKIEQLINLFEFFRIKSETLNALEMLNLILKHTGIVHEYKKDQSLENLNKLENIESLVSGVSDFISTAEDEDNTKNKIEDYIENIALITDFDNDTKDLNRVTLMTIHLSKGLEFPEVYIVGIEENLFPSALNLNTPTDLEEERRLFYVAITRAEKKVWLTYAENRSRWGKMTDAEPSRFLSEIDESYIKNENPSSKNSDRNFGTFGTFESPKLRTTKPVNNIDKKTPNSKLLRLKKLKPDIATPHENNFSSQEYKINTRVLHERFGEGIIVEIKGHGRDKTLKVEFVNGNTKNLIVRFAKLTIIDP